MKMSVTEQKSIREELMDVQNLILENQYLQEKYPEKKRGLEISLISLKKLESEMFEALKNEKLNQNREIYEIHLDGLLVNYGTIPMKKYGEFLIHGQELISSLADKPLGSNQSLSSKIQKETELDVYATCSGSLRILLISKQAKLDNDENNSKLINAFEKLNVLSNYDGDILEFTKHENIGKKQVSYFKKLMKSLSDMHLNMEIKKPNFNDSDDIICDINEFKSYKMYKMIEDINEPKENTIEVEGIVRAVDLDDKIFKIESNYDNKKETIKCNFDKKFEEIIASNLNKEISVAIKSVTSDYIDKRSKYNYELLEFN